MSFPAKLVDEAKTQLKWWTDGSHIECENGNDEGKNRVGVYWKEGLGLSGLDGCDRKVAWSAAFICYCLRKAGMPLIEFAFSPGHHAYIRWAIANSKGSKRNKTYYGRKREDYVPKPGDLVACWRKNDEDDPDPNITFDNQPDSYYPSHCDIVVENRGNKVVTIGGNVSHKVKITEYQAENGVLKPFKELICVLECAKR